MGFDILLIKPNSYVAIGSTEMRLPPQPFADG